MDTVKEKIHEMRLLISVKELDWFKKEFPGIKWEAGDTTLRWNANNAEEVKLARQAYDAYKKKHPNAMAFRVKADDRKDTTEIKEFDANAEVILMQEWNVKG